MTYFNRDAVKFLKVFAICVASSAYAIEGFQGELTYEKFFRLNTPPRKADTDQWIGLSFKSDDPVPTDHDYYFEYDARFYFEDRDFNSSVPEGYFQLDYGPLQVNMGRKLVDWHPFESYWGLNNLNANQGFSLLGEKQEGLIGAHIDYKPNRYVRIQGFLSYLFVPQLNPAMEEDNGRIISHSEWVRLPPDRIYDADSDVVRNTHYVINKPDVWGDVIKNRSLGFEVEFMPSKELTVTQFAIYKPENQLRTNAVGQLDLYQGYKVRIDAFPVVNHHFMFGGYAKWENKRQYVKLGYDVMDPNYRLPGDFDDQSESQTQKQNQNYLFNSRYGEKITPTFDRESFLYAAASAYKSDRVSVHANYIEKISSNTRGGDDFFTDTVKWVRALGGRFNWNVSDQLAFMFDYKVDLKRRDEIVKSETSYLLPYRFKATLGVQLIKAPRRESYWSYYRANDIFYSNLSYTF